ncbi:hypothetical protein K469DRAFT_270213 [Zopfia rhizophila CBS 207.26]|uniref:Uncharacterized protein n=1 Tax=Zopfia rhizophila CBS 207.26 TaxID=1314779 RepID=A0A6A6DP28_9PEZI|nr:hypothetical protein K469DRAFT_270213 [Zopfia rhizophila CBS 207.26]
MPATEFLQECYQSYNPTAMLESEMDYEVHDKKKAGPPQRLKQWLRAWEAKEDLSTAPKDDLAEHRALSTRKLRRRRV